MGYGIENVLHTEQLNQFLTATVYIVESQGLTNRQYVRRLTTVNDECLSIIHERVNL